jgi:hypothetical protein
MQINCKKNAFNRLKKVLFTPKFVYAWFFGGGCNTREGRGRTNSESLQNVKRSEGKP